MQAVANLSPLAIFTALTTKYLLGWWLASHFKLIFTGLLRDQYEITCAAGG